jgi:hypothetical protein
MNHPLFGARRKVPCYILLTYGLTESAFNQCNSALPSLAQLRSSREGAAIEIKVLLDEALA